MPNTNDGGFLTALSISNLIETDKSSFLAIWKISSPRKANYAYQIDDSQTRAATTSSNSTGKLEISGTIAIVIFSEKPL